MGITSTIALTKTVVDAAEPRGNRYAIWDSRMPGFGMRIDTTGRKTFVVRYRAEGGGRSAAGRFMTVGRFGVLTVEDAWKKAKQLLAAVTVGG